MKTEVKVYAYSDKEIQRVQIVRFDDWSQIEFLRPDSRSGAVSCFADIYQSYLIPACPWIFKSMIVFQLPEVLRTTEWDMLEAECGKELLSGEIKELGKVEDKLTTVAAALKQGVRIKDGKPVFRDSSAEELWKRLKKHNCIRIVRGKLPGTKVIPVDNFCGYLSEAEPEAAAKVNAHFFIMDPFDCATLYDHVGTPFGLSVKDGVILQPPMYGREALLVNKNGSVSVKNMDVKELEIEIGGIRFRHGKNAALYSRPQYARTPKKTGKSLVIVGNRVVAVKESGSVPVPASGFVLCPGDVLAEPGDEVIYHGLEDISFGIQVGNSIVKDGLKTKQFLSKFYNIRHLERIPFPPSLYPMDYDKARAARIALGADRSGRPMLLWAEGAGKLKYVPGEDSAGASLKELAEIAMDLRMYNGVHLDGGGSAQILLGNQRSLKISDRKKNNSEAERLVPSGLFIKQKDGEWNL